MTKSSVASQASTAPSESTTKSKKTGLRLLRYLVLGIGINVGLWGLTLTYLKVTKPTYVSEWTLVLPETGTSTRVDIPALGGATSDVKSPYSDRSQDPRSKYQVVAEGDAVLKTAAQKLNMSLEEFGEPRITVVDNTTLMEFGISGATPQEAHDKALALQSALDDRIKQLRAEEVRLKDSSIQKSVTEAKQKLDLAQKRLAEFKGQTGLGSQAQLEQVSDRLEELRRQQVDLISQREQADANLSSLSSNMNLSARQADEAFVLKTDQLFQQHLKDYNDATAALTLLGAKFLPSHPAVLAEKSKQESSRSALLARSQSLLGRPTTLTNIARLNLNAGAPSASAREALLQQLVQAQADAQSRGASTQEFNAQIAALESRYRSMARNSVTLESLERDVRITETLFSSALAALDVGRSRTDSYPPLQMLIAPSLPKKAASPKKSLALLGAALGSLLVSGGLFSLWLRPYWLSKRNSKSQLNPSPSSTPEVVLIGSKAQLETLNLQQRETYNGERTKSSDQEELRVEQR